MKNTKKIVSLVLAICMLASLAISASAANTVDASGGTGTSSVTLSSTADGSIGGDPAATKMSVTVPTVLPIAVGTDGTVSTATDAKDCQQLVWGCQGCECFHRSRAGLVAGCVR